MQGRRGPHARDRGAAAVLTVGAGAGKLWGSRQPRRAQRRRFVKAVGKTYQPIASAAALRERPVEAYSTAQGRWCTAASPDVSLRGAKRRGNLGKAVTISPMAFPRCGRVLQDCTPRALPRASRSGRHVGLRPPRNDNSGAFAILTVACTDCKCIAGLGCPLPCNAQLAALCHKINAAKIVSLHGGHGPPCRLTQAVEKPAQPEVSEGRKV